MNPLTVSAIAVAVVLLLAVLVALIFWLRRPSPVPPAAPLATMPAQAPAPPHVAYPFEDEWEAQAPYPDYAPHIGRPSESLYRPASDNRAVADTHFRQRDAFALDDVEALESHDTSPSHQASHALQQDSGFSMFRPSVGAESSPSSSGDAPIRCPHCSSARIDTLNVARMAGSTIGSVAGATSGIAMALSGAEAGAAVGAVGGPLGAIFGGLTGAVLAGLFGSAAGNAAGSILGAAIDDNMLDNYRCLLCGHTFGAQHG